MAHPGRADRDELLLLQHPQQLGLQRRADVADLVEKQGPLVRLLDQAALGRHRAGEGPLDVAEELALEQGVGERGAVDGQKTLLAAAAAVVDGGGDQLLAGAALPLDEDAGSGGRDLLGQLEDAAEGGALEDHLVGIEAASYLRLEGAVLLEEAVVADDLVDQVEQLVGEEGLEEVVAGSLLEGFDRAAHGGEGAHHHHRLFGAQGLDPAQHFQAVGAGGPDIEQDQVGTLLAVLLQGAQQLVAAGEELHLVTVGFQRLAQQLLHLRLVVADKDASLFHGRGSSPGLVGAPHHSKHSAPSAISFAGYRAPSRRPKSAANRIRQPGPGSLVFPGKCPYSEIRRSLAASRETAIMHELGITQSIVDIAVRTALEQGATRVRSVTVEIGELAGVVADSVAFCFEACRAGDPARGCRVDHRSDSGQGPLLRLRRRKPGRSVHFCLSRLRRLHSGAPAG